MDIDLLSINSKGQRMLYAVQKISLTIEQANPLAERIVEIINRLLLTTVDKQKVAKPD